MREVDDAHDAEDQRQAARDQEQQQPVLHAVEALDEKVRRGPCEASGSARARVDTVAGGRAAGNCRAAASHAIYILQPGDGSASAFTATPSTLFFVRRPCAGRCPAPARATSTA